MQKRVRSRGLGEVYKSQVVVAPATGTVIDLPIKVGDSVSQSQPLARIAAPKDMQLVADVDELDLPNVVIGATVTFRLDAYPERELQGVVRTTAPQARVQGCLLYTSPSPRDRTRSRMPSSA